VRIRATLIVIFSYFCSIAMGAESRLEIAQLQLALDQAGFSAGVIDGKFGQHTTRALQLYRETFGQSPSITRSTFEHWKVPQGFFDDLAPIPSSWLARSKLPRQSFERKTEKLSETFHISEDFLRFLNPQIPSWDNLDERIAIKVPVLKPSQIKTQAKWIEVSLSQKVIRVYSESDKLIASFPCSIAAKKEKRPVGVLTIKTLVQDPDYLFDPKLFSEVPEAKTLSSKLMIQPGPNNPVGEVWIGLSLRGYGIHGTPWPEDIGKTESHGCFRLTNWDAERLLKMLSTHTQVLVKD
jgi:lipoprotein-anchoring transpeptidase ErfK/SrfK